MQTENNTHDSAKKGITLVRIERHYTWNDAAMKCVVKQDAIITKDLERFFENASEQVKKTFLSDIIGYLSLDMEALADGYRCVYFDCDDEKRWSGQILDGLDMAIEYTLYDNDLLMAKVDEQKMLSHLSRNEMATKERNDRVVYLSRYIESSATDSCDLLLDMITQLLSSDGNYMKSAHFVFTDS